MLDGCEAVKVTTAEVYDQMTHVHIDEDAIERVALDLMRTDAVAIDWDEHGWHYSADAKCEGPLTCQYILVLDALNFCFWPTNGLQYEHLACGLANDLQHNTHALDADRLARISAEEVLSWFAPYTPPMINERVRKVQEVGQVLLAHFDGLAANLVGAASGSAAALTLLIAQFFPGFRDHAIYKGRQVFFYKRAQIFVGDVWAAYGRQLSGPFGFSDIGALTTFADYRVPQLLRAYGVMKYSNALGAAIDKGCEIHSGTEEEIEIRAATVVAVDRVHAAMQRRGATCHVIELDWLLWQKGEMQDQSNAIADHHRTLTIYY